MPCDSMLVVFRLLYTARVFHPPDCAVSVLQEMSCSIPEEYEYCCISEKTADRYCEIQYCRYCFRDCFSNGTSACTVFDVHVFFVSDTLAINSTAQAYTRMYKAVALSKSVEYPVLYTVIPGIAIVESGSGQSRTARELNNHFGIVGKNSLECKTRYRQYEDVKESYNHFCRVLSKKPFYSNLKSMKNHVPRIRALSRAGYAEMPSVWEKRVLGVIEEIYIL